MQDKSQKRKSSPQPLSEREGTQQSRGVQGEDLEDIFINLLPNGKVYFQGNREINPGLQIIEMNSIPSNAMGLYVLGFKYLALKEKAAEHLKNLSESKLLDLINLKKKEYPDDVPVLEKALELKRQ